MAHTFVCEVSLQSWLIWPTVRRHCGGGDSVQVLKMKVVRCSVRQLISENCARAFRTIVQYQGKTTTGYSTQRYLQPHFQYEFFILDHFRQKGKISSILVKYVTFEGCFLIIFSYVCIVKVSRSRNKNSQAETSSKMNK